MDPTQPRSPDMLDMGDATSALFLDQKSETEQDGVNVPELPLDNGDKASGPSQQGSIVSSLPEDQGTHKSSTTSSKTSTLKSSMSSTCRRRTKTTLPREHEVFDRNKSYAILDSVRMKMKVKKDPKVETLKAKNRFLDTHPPRPDLPLMKFRDQKYKDALRQEAANVMPPPLSEQWIDNICKKIPEELRARYPALVKRYLEELKAEYLNTLHELKLQIMFRPNEGEEVPLLFHAMKYDVGGKTSNYKKFEMNRHKIGNNLFLLLPQIRKLFSTVVSTLPHTLVDFTRYRLMGHMTLDNLLEKFQKDIRDAEMQIIGTWYPRIIALLTRKGALGSVPPQQLPRVLKCATNIVSIQITELVRRTIDNLIDSFSNKLTTPLLLCEGEYAGVATMQPTVVTISDKYQSIVDHLNNVIIQLPAMEVWFPSQSVKPVVEIRRTTSYVVNSHEVFAENLKQLFQPLDEHFEMILNKFLELKEDRVMQDLEEWLKDEHSYDELFDKISHYKQFDKKIAQLLNNEEFYFGRLNQENEKEDLKTHVNKYVDRIVSTIASKNRTDLDRIDEEFQTIVRRIEKEPRNTEVLVTLGQYIKYINAKLLDEKREQILEYTDIATRLMGITQLTPEHHKAFANAIQWLERIQPILRKADNMYKRIKSDMEKKCQAAAENLKANLAVFTPNLKFLNDLTDYQQIFEYNVYIKSFLRDINRFNEDMEWINKEEALFKWPQSTYPELVELKSIVYPFAKLIFLAFSWFIKRKYFMFGCDFEKLKLSEVEQFVDETYKELVKMQKTYKAKCKLQALENHPNRFTGTVDDADPNNWPAPLKLIEQVHKSIKEFRPAMPLIGIMCNEALRDRHWDEMSDIANVDLQPNAGTTLEKLMDLKLDDLLNQFDIISIGATKELALEDLLKRMKKEWNEMLFTTATYKDTGLKILTALDEVQALLDDHILKSLSMRGSSFVKPIVEEVTEWCETLDRANKTLAEWIKVQGQWLYLLPIFSSKDIIAQMPEEATMFQEVDASFRDLMKMIEDDPRVLSTAAAPGVLETVIECNEKMESINNGVNAYLEKKRLYFPRFFFLSNDEMLEILSETKDPLRVQPHLKKLFEGISKLAFNEKMDILAMISGEGEKVEMNTIVSTADARGSVEKWLVQVEDQMKQSVRRDIEVSLGFYPTESRETWVTKWPGQVVLCVTQIFWTTEVHESLASKDPKVFKAYAESLTPQLNRIINLVRGKLSNLLRITLGALVVLDVHSKDVTVDLANNNVSNDTDFKWLAQLRYYWETDDVLVKITNATVHYAYEYLGNTPRLVITPLTDRCYRTLVGAYHLHLNGAPEGPAGTGKTETTKDLAKALATQCVVFNCSDGLDYIAMGKFFKGLASSGAWVCFDEFNRIDVEVLSVVAQQILCIVQAVRQNVETFIFEGTELRLVPTCYVCITMNPGYAGRSELPDNLKVLFRTVAMMVPDYALIGEISLYSYGFLDARKLSIKIVTTYRLCSEQLSSQSHYDYGMRAVKTVLIAAGNLKMKFPNESEDILLLRSIIDVNLAKFLFHDVPLFNGIISDLFPGVTLPEADYEAFLNAVKEVCAKRNLQPVESFLIKLIQTYEMMVVRHGFMLVGEPFSGKTVTLHVLADALTLQNARGEDEQKVIFNTLNPKSITMGQLYGEFDDVSHEWTDGVIATTFREFSMSETPDRKWIIFDGPVDAVWIENMNTVLDDNKKLCLNSGEVMSMPNTMSMIFEVMDLTQASPATVSRCGMIYMEPSTLGWRPLVQSYVNSLPNDWPQEYIQSMFEWLTDPCLYHIRKNCVQLVTGGVANCVTTVIHLVDAILKDALAENDNVMSYFTIWIQAAFIMASVWGFGGNLDTNSIGLFDMFFRELWKGDNEENPPKQAIECQLPIEGLVHDYFYVFKQKGSWKSWPDQVKTLKTEECINFQDTLIPTTDSAKYCFMLDLHVRHKLPFLLMGPTGTGKSFYIRNYLMKLDMEVYTPGFITFTTATTANFTQELVLTKLVKRKRGVYGPLLKKTAVFFIDDMNMPVKEVYGAQPPIELLRMFFDHKYWFEFPETSKLYLEDILLTAAIAPPGGSRQDIYIRFLRHFNIFSVNSFSNDNMQRIFSNIMALGYKRNGFSTDIQSTANLLVAATTEMYNSAIQSLKPTPAKSHYIFNLRDFSRVISGCLLVRRESITDKKFFVRLWVHEASRVFCDRLIDDDDKNWFLEKVKVIVKEQLKDNFDAMLSGLTTGPITIEAVNSLIYTTALDQDAAEPSTRKYEEIPSTESFYKMAVETMAEYNATHKSKISIVLFKYALEHLSRICRNLSISSGNCLLVGVGGSGRQSLIRLAAAVYQYNVFQPEITSTYSFTDWRDDIKKLLKETGGRNAPAVFLFTESQIKEESFLTDIDSLLSSGEVPNLFAIDEQQEIIEMVRKAAQGGNTNLDISPLSVLNFFIGRCKQNLHICICFSPIGAAFRSRLRLFPSLVTCCTIDWYESWPENALEMVAQSYLEKVNLTDDVKIAAVAAFKHFHITASEISDRFYADTGRKTYITSASYLALIRSYTEFVNFKLDETMAAKMRYVGGLEKLDFAAQQVGIMQVDLEELQPKLKVAAIETSEMMEVIEKETKQVEIVSSRVKEDEAKANIQAEAATALKEECEADLALAIPVLEEAINALDTLKPSDIVLVKSMKNPPEIIKLVMAAVCVMKGIKPDKINDPNKPGQKIIDYWGPSKKLLGDMNFLQNLKEYKKDNIDPEIMKEIRTRYIPDENFKPQIVAKASSAAEGLCKWVIALDMYDAVNKVVGPKKEKLDKAEKEFEETMGILNEKRSQVRKLEEKLNALQSKFNEAQSKKEKLEADVKLCSFKLEKAQKLLGGLGGEKDRWTQRAAELQFNYDCLPGDILLSCGIIAYLAPFNNLFRQTCLDDWMSFVMDVKIPSSPKYNMVEVLGSEIKIQRWNIFGLPRDTFSIENAIIMDSSKRWSLFIDPQGQANKWIKNMEKANDLEVLKLSMNYIKAMESCIEQGRPVLIECILEDLDAPLDPILMKQTFTQGNQEYIALGENVIEYNPQFRLYLTTKLRNPHYLPEVFNKVTVVNFALTVFGLEDQLLGIVVAKERPDLQTKRDELIVQGASNKKALKEVEDMILHTLSSSTGNILEDPNAVDVLDSSKTLSIEIQQKQAVAKETEVIIENFRQSYRPVAKHSAGLYYCITDLPNVDPMYQYSLPWFINIYVLSIQTA
ncbi:hypothetical protein M8J77_019695 [Diaphorina citri]|nr:hypothetical protein M8J77_019695 [Diaphorina citri]